MNYPDATTEINHFRLGRIISAGEHVYLIAKVRQVAAHLVHVDILAAGVHATQKGQGAGMFTEKGDALTGQRMPPRENDRGESPPAGRRRSSPQ